MSEKKRKYCRFDPSKGYPFGDDLFYECLRCSDVVPSSPEKSTDCSCGNVMIDVGYSRISVQDHSQVKLFRRR